MRGELSLMLFAMNFLLSRRAWLFLPLMGFLLLSGCDQSAHKSPEIPLVKIETFDELVLKHRCLSCHLPNNQMDLPVWSEIAEKYAGKQDAKVFLMKKISTGGSGSWGQMNMPPYPEISESAREVLVQGILAAKK